MRTLKVLLIAGALVVADMATDGLIITDAQAVIGRPATPASAAGVARRTTRRVIRRTTVYVATLPVGCQTVVVEGMTLSQCGSTYYQASGSQYVVVVID